VMNAAMVIEALCQGCGACVSACPNKAAMLSDRSDRQMFAALDAAM
jgi:ferredoxin